MATILNLLGAANRYRGLLRSQYWSEDELRAYSRTALDETLRAAARIPFYSAHFGGSPRPDDLPQLPTIGRREIGDLNRSILSLYPDGVHCSSDSSTGSTGTPAEFIFDAHHQQGRFAARARYLREHGWTPFKRTAWLIYVVFRTLRNDDEGLMQSRLRMSNHFIPASPGLEGKVEELCRIDPIFLYTFPSYLDILLDRLAETGRKLPSLKKIFTGAEVLEDSLRQRTKAALGVDIAQNYGSTEAFLAWECPAGNLHINAEHVLLEIVDERGHAVAPGQIGRVLVTTLENRLAPLVRYEIGDYALAAAGRCECGRTLPLIGKILGRAMNLFRLHDGQLISPWHLSSAVRNCAEVKQFQIVQNAVGRFTVRFISDGALIADAEEIIQAGFRRILGDDVLVNFQRVLEIPRTGWQVHDCALGIGGLKPRHFSITPSCGRLAGMSALGMALDAAPRYAFLLRSQYWRPEQLREYTERQLERTLAAAAKIPFYTDRLGGAPKPGDFARLPILERTDIAALNSSVRSMYPPDQFFLRGASSGSTEMQAEFLFDRSRVRGRYAARIRYLRAHGWSPLRRTIFHQVRLPRADSDWVKHRILPGFMTMTTDLVEQVERIVKIDPLYLYMFPSNLEGMLRILQETNQKLRSIRRVFTVAETVDETLRQLARRILGVEIADNYGATEGFIAWQCPQGSYHINAEHVLVELIDEMGRNVAPGRLGRVLITTLENYLMPLVRYDLGDYAVAAEGACGCGRTLPRLGRHCRPQARPLPHR